MDGGVVVGTVSSGGYGHRVGKNIAYAFLDAPFATEGQPLVIDMLGQEISATVTNSALYDPDMSRVRA